MRVAWRPAARDDRRRITAWLAERNPAAAVRVTRALLAAAGSLAVLPEKGRPGRVPGTRELSPLQPYVLLQRQFEDDDGGVCYVETHEPARYAGHFRLRLVKFTPTHLAFEIDRPEDQLVEITFWLGAPHFREIERVMNIIFGRKV